MTAGITPSESSTTPVDLLLGRRKPMAIGLLAQSVVSMIVAIIATVQSARIQAEELDGGISLELTLGIFFMLFGLAQIAGALWMQFRPADSRRESVRIRTDVMLVYGILGLLFSFFGIWMAYRLSDGLISWVNTRVVSRETWSAVLSIFVAALGLLALILSAQYARVEERNDATLRRWLYGSNAVVTGVLLLLILVGVNVFVFVKVPSTLDTTAQKFFSLRPELRDAVLDLETPVKAYLIMFEDGPPFNLFSNTRQMLLNCQEANRKFQVEVLSPGTDPVRVQSLRKKFPEISPDAEGGILLTIGDDEATRGFIPVNELAARLPGESQNPQDFRIVYQGQSKLLSELRFLSDSKTKPTVYFTSGHGELDVGDAAPGARTPRSAAKLADYLRKRNINVKTFAFDPLSAEAAKIPEDATLVVVAGPTQTVSPKLVSTLREYLNRGRDGKGTPGRLFALLDATQSNPLVKKISPTGLEPLLSEYGVNVTNQVMITQLRDGIVTDAVVGISDALANRDNRLAQSFVDRQYLFQKPRRIEAGQGNNGPFMPEVLLESVFGVRTWVEESLDLDPKEIQDALRTPDGRAARQYGVAPKSLGVIVSEQGPPASDDPRAAPKETPRLAVYGTSAFVSDAFTSQLDDNVPYFELFAGTVDWLRDRPVVNLDLTEYKFYRIPKGISGVQLVVLPALLMLLTIVCGSVGMWLVRRR
ncbi:Gldg family protein [Tuwongella immobilis]|uniref:ABC-type uncharacterized transport system domain-containing protein n=1 Tax=Tuwongella immobilis TaxID=692036 RepID=A0A6C2YSG1_9BACT|nr:Gldg family protein [Tuwongella immobilis]VIP03812.1 ABC-type uncharacterized transporter OS=Singulisphaera acidiphila (strain ATCC BAA-1392 / DSM 18658 / VKM B-2454 / MOB10) GN=Sinac_5949 PE=4 SV=1: ABC_transp_aux [Tuwongella immobilis]VTS04991.1 ABC-type uncharacterized transporter OS=Singulisphaera acidiphila (strain ATCC BAA-1392 / DSM 18658 / VKM B-2454 / MOB10) GN=Sinac_5949 PE=4 SV=1: ABC_transp_aux [Tuwongella immobilis]